MIDQEYYRIFGFSYCRYFNDLQWHRLMVIGLIAIRIIRVTIGCHSYWEITPSVSELSAN